MRRVLTFVAALVAGCSSNPDAKREPSGTLEGRLSIWTDPQTACRYLFHEGGAGNARTEAMTIRFRANGTPDCPGPMQLPVDPR